MKADKKAERLAALFGIEAPKKASPLELRRKANVSREAEAVILFAENPERFLQRECRICKRHFAVNRSHIAFCSDDCRSVHLNDVVGLEWDPNARTPEERWASQTGGPEPLIVPPAILPTLLERQTQSTPVSAPEDVEFVLDMSSVDALLAE